MTSKTSHSEIDATAYENKLPDQTIRYVELDELVNTISIDEKRERRVRKKILLQFLRD